MPPFLLQLYLPREKRLRSLFLRSGVFSYLADATDSDQEAAEKFLKAVESLVNELDTPTLEQFGINKEEFFNVIDKMAHDAMDSGSPQNTMRDVTEEEVKEIYRKLW